MFTSTKNSYAIKIWNIKATLLWLTLSLSTKFQFRLVKFQDTSTETIMYSICWTFAWFWRTQYYLFKTQFCMYTYNLKTNTWLSRPKIKSHLSVQNNFPSFTVSTWFNKQDCELFWLKHDRFLLQYGASKLQCMHITKNQDYLLHEQNYVTDKTGNTMLPTIPELNRTCD